MNLFMESVTTAFCCKFAEVYNSWKFSIRHFSISSRFDVQSLDVAQIFYIEFFLFLWVALLWKNLEILSPSFAHKTFALWNHILFSLSMSSVISLFNSLTRLNRFSLLPSRHPLEVFFFFANSFLTFPKWFRLHVFNYLPHFSTFLITLVEGSTMSLEDHTASTTLEQPWSRSHISLKQNGLVETTTSNPLGTIQRG